MVKKIDLFQDYYVEGEGRHFRLIFNLSPNPILIRMMVFLNLRVMYTTLLVLANRTRKIILRTFFVTF